MKTITRFFALLALLVGSAVAQAAGTETSVIITAIESVSTGVVYIFFSAVPSSGPTCGNTGHGFAINGTTAGPAQVVALAQLAFVSGKTVTAVGTGACDVNGSYETLSYVTTTD